MVIEDRVYGTVRINEKILLELIKSKPVQRLKGINQAGASQYVFPDKKVTRYEHSLGVMILLEKLGASLEEQIAGLLHDTPHTAFSHVIDFVFPSEKHDFHEKFYEKIILNSEIPVILRNYGFNVKRILNEKNFPLLERELPDLCADRVDYTLRDLALKYGYMDKIRKYMGSFIVYKNEIIISDIIIGKKFAEDYMEMDKTIWSNPLEVALFKILADAIKIGLDEKILSLKDLFQYDSFVYNKLNSSENKEILKKLSMLSPGLKIKDDPLDYDFHTINKLRYINPKCREGGLIQKVADLFPEFQEKIDKHKEWIGRGNHTKIIMSEIEN